MKTVKEVAEQTGISVRTLHYDAVGTVLSTSKEQSPYR